TAYFAASADGTFVIRDHGEPNLYSYVGGVSAVPVFGTHGLAVVDGRLVFGCAAPGDQGLLLATPNRLDPEEFTHWDSVYANLISGDGQSAAVVSYQGQIVAGTTDGTSIHFTRAAGPW
ncbi:MAG TPA: hypothetical protein VEI97_09185, partial [bacterium]|nr:hypothetical protein [bacterium]